LGFAGAIGYVPLMQTSQNSASNDYSYPVTQCDVPAERRGALQAYRDKRRLWLSWIDSNEHHAIWDVLSSNGLDRRRLQDADAVCDRRRK
jgi:hypothetical protein